jgi:hypothetical protein
MHTDKCFDFGVHPWANERPFARKFVNRFIVCPDAQYCMAEAAFALSERFPVYPVG